MYSQIFNMVDVGIVILDKDMRIDKWNRWMANHSKMDAEEVIGKSLLSLFPNLDSPSFNRNFKTVLKFGNFAFFSQKLHGYLFPFNPISNVESRFEHMQQSCSMGPLRDENNRVSHVFIMVDDVSEIAVYEQKLVEMTTIDALTNVYNRRFLETRIAEEFERHRRYSKPFSVIMLDIDFFKKVNDTHGHEAGDFILKSFADLIVGNIRTVDILARYGGEEFCCMLPETDLDSAMVVAHRLREKVEAFDFDFNGTLLKITVSLGIAEIRDGVNSAADLLNQADQSLYKAKETGRNKIVTMDDL